MQKPHVDVSSTARDFNFCSESSSTSILFVHITAGSPEPSLLDTVISTKISCAGSNIYSKILAGEKCFFRMPVT